LLSSLGEKVFRETFTERFEMSFAKELEALRKIHDDDLLRLREEKTQRELIEFSGKHWELIFEIQKELRSAASHGCSGIDFQFSGGIRITDFTLLCKWFGDDIKFQNIRAINCVDKGLTYDAIVSSGISWKR
jgi:hypothetical protein